MSQPNSVEQQAPEQPVQKQKLNVYTVMLIISCLAILTSILLLYLELRRWGSPPWWSVASRGPAVQQVGEATWDWDALPPATRAGNGQLA